MTESNYIFEKGEPINVGSHGEHDFVYSKGVEVTDTGASSFVFEAGTGLGGGTFVVGGTSIGVYATNESHASWIDYTTDPVSPQTQGVEAAGAMPYPDTHTMYVWVHHDTGADTYMLGITGWKDDSGSGRGFRTSWPGLGQLVTSTEANDPTHQNDDAEQFGDVYETDGNGDPTSDNTYNSGNSDGVGYVLQSGSVSVDFSFGQSDNGNSPPEQIVARGPDGNEAKISGTSTTVELTIP